MYQTRIVGDHLETIIEVFVIKPSPFIVFTVVGGAIVLALVVWIVNWEYVATLEFGVAWEYRQAFLRGLKMTLVLTVASTLMGYVGGLLLAMGSQTPFRPIRWLVAAYVEIWRNTPLLVQVIWIHFALPLITGVNTTAFQSGLITLTLNVTAYFAEIARAGIESIHRGQWEAAKALGLKKLAIWLRVILPQAVRIIVPPMANMVIGIFKGTAILSILSVNDLMRVTNQISNFTFKPVEIITTAALIYFVIGSSINWLSTRVEHRFQKSDG